jgi:hypothetical protein
MAIAVMVVIILLNIALLVIVMRLGTQGEHHSEFTAEQSTAVMTLQNRLGIASSASTPADDSSDTDVVETSADESDSE